MPKYKMVTLLFLRLVSKSNNYNRYFDYTSHLKAILHSTKWQYFQKTYSYLSNKRGGWNKRGGGAKFAKLLNVEVGINVEGGILWKKLMHNSNKRGVEGGKNLRNQ